MEGVDRIALRDMLRGVFFPDVCKNRGRRMDRKMPSKPSIFYSGPL